MNYQFVDYERDGHIAIIRMNRPERLNSQSNDMVRDINAAWRQFMGDDDAWVAIYTGTGRSFCSGMDIKEAAARGEKRLPARTPLDNGEVTKPVIGAINGFALGGGFLWTMLCDLRIAAESATFQIAEVLRNRIPTFLVRGLVDVFPHCQAVELGLGKKLSAQHALEMGLLNKVVPDSELMAAARQMAEEISELPPLAAKAVVEGVRKLRKARMVGPDVEAWIAATIDSLMSTEDYKESLDSFLEKRKPVYKGR
ncbi:MAG: enoyl-CoA hydratase-related protein [Dehalococcoidia bacterium]|jgi:enoyl-CoA hydratase/carnithine racemase|nr:enoyl-CoA hydratase-related protein [Dehalococcoidia bacterium]MDP6510245.1 enoyl-CoA hydratase-related protein [Dehalococcoidia bacterium]